MKDESKRFRAASLIGFVAGVMSGGSFMWLIRYFSYTPVFSPGMLFFKLILNFIIGIVLPLSAIILGSVDLKKIKTIHLNTKGKGFDITAIVLGSVFLLPGLLYNVTEIIFNSSALGMILFNLKEIPVQ